MKIFAERLRDLRIEQGLSVWQVGQAIGVSHAAISRWENELRIPNIENLAALAKFFKVRSDYLIGLED